MLTLSFLLFVSASYTPLPGASGAQEGGFLLYFRGIFTGGTVGLALLAWRFFTYYLFLITGVIVVLNEKFLMRREYRRLAAEAPKGAETPKIPEAAETPETPKTPAEGDAGDA